MCRGASTQRPTSPVKQDNPGSFQGHDLSSWGKTVRDPERRQRVDFEETFRSYLKRSPICEPDRRTYKPNMGEKGNIFRQVLTDQDYPATIPRQTTYLKRPTPQVIEGAPYRDPATPRHQQPGLYRTQDEIPVRPMDYNRLRPQDNFAVTPRGYDNRYHFNDIKPRPPYFDGKPDAWEPFLMQIQLMSRSFGWPDYKFRDQLMFALRHQGTIICF